MGSIKTMGMPSEPALKALFGEETTDDPDKKDAA